MYEIHDIVRTVIMIICIILLTEFILFTVLFVVHKKESLWKERLFKFMIPAYWLYLLWRHFNKH